MKVLVVSDSHGNINALRRAAAITGPDVVLHLGDHDSDCAEIRSILPDAMIRAVRGNCDPTSRELDADEFVLEGKRIFMVHGHNHGVKYGLEKFCTSVWCSGSKLGLYGHTHRPLWQEIRGMQIMNPGSIGSAQHPTFGLVRLENGAADCRILDAQTDR